MLFLAGSIVLPYAIEPHIHPNETIPERLDDAFTYVAFAQPVMWLLLLLIDRYLQYKHIVLRRYGYLDFTQNTRYIRRTAEFMFSLGNAAMLVVVMLCYKVIPPSNSVNPTDKKAGTVYGVNLQEIIIGIESLVALFCCIRYAIYVYKFNSAKLAPDVEHEEQMIAVMQPSTHLPDIGYRLASNFSPLNYSTLTFIIVPEHFSIYIVHVSLNSPYPCSPDNFPPL